MFLLCNVSDGRCVSLANLLQFFTGANRVPATGFDMTPKITFTTQDVYLMHPHVHLVLCSHVPWVVYLMTTFRINGLFDLLDLEQFKPMTMVPGHTHIQTDLS